MSATERLDAIYELEGLSSSDRRQKLNEVRATALDAWVDTLNEPKRSELQANKVLALEIYRSWLEGTILNTRRNFPDYVTQGQTLMIEIFSLDI